MSSSIPIPSTQTAAILGKNKDVLEIKQIPVPKIASDDVLVKVEASAVNPTDWKHLVFGWGAPGTVSGCDIAGSVAAIGSNVQNVKIGDTGFAFIHGSNTVAPQTGGFSEYAVVKSHLFYKFKNPLHKSKENEIPQEVPTTFEGASSLGVSVVTIAISLVHNLGGSIGLSEKNPEEANKYLLIWGGATSTGQVAIQFAKLIGWKVIVVASKKNEDQLKALGAEAVFDYHDSDVVQQIKNYGGENIVYALDTIALPNTIQLIHDATSDTLPVKIDNLLFHGKKSIKNFKSNATITDSLAYFATGNPFVWGDRELGKPDVAEFAKSYYSTLENVLNNGSIKHIPIKVLPNGFNSANEAFSLLKNDKVSNQKLVLRPSDTK